MLYFVLQLNTFQVVLVTGEGQTYIIFLFDQIQWTTADSCGGSNGLGGSHQARVGFAAGDGMRGTEIPGSGFQNGLLALDEVEMHVYHVDNEDSTVEGYPPFGM